MKEFIDKLIERLEENKIKRSDDSPYGIGVLNGYAEAISIVNQLAEEYKLFGNSEQVKGGWIACSERLPEDGVKVLCYGSNALGRMRYEVSCYSHKLRWWKCSVITDVFAWMPLPAPYTE